MIKRGKSSPSNEQKEISIANGINGTENSCRIVFGNRIKRVQRWKTEYCVLYFRNLECTCCSFSSELPQDLHTNENAYDCTVPNAIWLVLSTAANCKYAKGVIIVKRLQQLCEW